MLKLDLRKFAGKFSEYTELRVQENRTIRIVLVNGTVMGGGRHEGGAGKSPQGIQLVVFVCGFCTNPDAVGLFIEDGVSGWDGFGGYMRKVVRCVVDFYKNGILENNCKVTAISGRWLNLI